MTQLLDTTKNRAVSLPYTERGEWQWNYGEKDLREAISEGRVALLPFCDKKVLLREGQNGFLIPAWLETSMFAPGLEELDPIFLGKDRGVLRFGIAVEEDIATSLAQARDAVWKNPRQIFSSLSAVDSSLLAYANGMLHWKKTHRYCGSCGSPNISSLGGQVMRCSNTSCGKHTYPRINPAVIMLIESVREDGEEVCLLARHRRSAENMMTTLAGFVEVGETLEQAVRREVMEETGIEVGSVRYITSQPWPFPSSLMMGFFGSGVFAAPTADMEEVQEARWFSREELRSAIGSGELLPSRQDSIARHLILTWLEGGR